MCQKKIDVITTDYHRRRSAEPANGTDYARPVAIGLESQIFLTYCDRETKSVAFT